MGNNRTHGWTHASVARALSIQATSVSKWLLGDRYPDIRMMHKIHSKFNWPAGNQAELVPPTGYDMRWAMVFRDVLNTHFDGEEIKYSRGAQLPTAKFVKNPEEVNGSPLGSRLVTATDKVMVLEEREDGTRYWIEPGTLEPFPRVQPEWLPGYLLPV